MSKIFHEYGGTIITVIAVVLLISFVTTSMNTGGVLYNAFGDMINSFSEKSNDMVDGAAGDSSEGEEAGWPVSWNTMDVMDNPKVDMGEGMYFVKVSDYTPTAAELADTKGTLSMDGETMSSACLGVEDLDGIVIAAYDDNGEIAVISVTTTEVVDALGIAFPETGLWTFDYGSLGMDADVTVDAATPIPEGAYYGNLASGLYSHMPDSVNEYDFYIYGDYMYVYSLNEYGGWTVALATEDTVGGTVPDYPFATSLQTSYDAILESVNGAPVTHLTKTFKGCVNLVSITIPDSVTSIGDAAFRDCTSLTSITIPDSVTSIGYAAFRDCTSLTSVTMPDSVTSIDGSAFSGCTGLTSVVIGEGVTIIWQNAFNGCTSLTCITIPDSVTSIGDHAFDNCTSLMSIIFENPNGWWYADSVDATSGTALSSTDLADDATAAEYLTDTHTMNFWFRG